MDPLIFNIGVTGQGKARAAQFIQDSLHRPWVDDEPDIGDDKEIVITVEMRTGDGPAWSRFQSEVRDLVDKYGMELAIAAWGFDIPETIDGSVVSESGIRELGSVPRPETEAQ